MDLTKQEHSLSPDEFILEDLSEIRETMPSLFDELNSDNLRIDIKEYESDNSEDMEFPSKNEFKKSRRKATTPQKAVQLEFSQLNSIENSSESSQDNDLSNQNDLILSEENECDDLFQGFSEDIFKDLQEEVDGETLDEEIIENVKEEWKANWGVKCNMCEQVFHRTEFEKHYVESYKLKPVFTCTFCNKSVEKYTTFRSHCYRHITEGRFKCKECPKGFSLQSVLHVHIIAKHTKAKPYMCEECGKSFVTKPGLKIHLKKHKTEVKEDYPCVECGKILHTRGGLTSHMNVHRLGRRFMCDVCGKTFTQKVNMQQHVKQHTGDKPHVCDKCGKTFAEKSHLARHYSFHSSERPFKCEVCQKMYKTERCLKVHSLVHAAERPFVCGYCNKGFLSSTKLKQHYNIHTGERPYKCKYCERSFTNYPNWLKHTRRRHKVDHKTGEELPSKQAIKEEPSSSTSITPSTTEQKLGAELPEKVEDNAETPEEILVANFINEPSINTSDPLIGDVKPDDFVSLTKAEELFLQQGLLNFPLLDDKMMLNQQLDLLTTNPGSSMNYLLPYFQTTLPSQTIMQTAAQNILPMTIQLNDLVNSNIVPQSCD